MERKWIPLLGIFLFLGSLTGAGSEEPDKLWFATGEPTLAPLPTGKPMPMLLLPPEQYSDLAAKLESRDSFVPIQELADDSRPLAGYGINLVFGGKNRGFTVRGTPESGYVLYADMDADGSLTDEKPFELELKGSQYVASLDIEAEKTVEGKSVAYPIKARFVISPAPNAKETGLQQVVEQTTVRKGTLDPGGKTMEFAVYGRAGIYDRPENPVWIDLNRDGQGPKDRYSDELFYVRDKHVTLDGTTYRFEVDPFGRSLTLAPLDKKLPPRPSLEVGAHAPGFSAPDIDGNSQILERYKGRIVLLDFWAVWCGPCRTEAPKLADVHREYTDHGLAILGVTSDAEPEIREFEDEFGHAWPQISEESGGPIHRQYRVVGYPAKYLIGRDGKVLCFTAGKGFWEECWPKAEEALKP